MSLSESWGQPWLQTNPTSVSHAFPSILPINCDTTIGSSVRIHSTEIITYLVLKKALCPQCFVAKNSCLHSETDYETMGPWLCTWKKMTNFFLHRTVIPHVMQIQFLGVLGPSVVLNDAFLYFTKLLFCHHGHFCGHLTHFACNCIHFNVFLLPAIFLWLFCISHWVNFLLALIVLYLDWGWLD